MAIAHPTGTRFKDRTGHRFGRLIAIEFMGVFNKNSKWKCVCDCGLEVVVWGMDLADGTTKSCGCLNGDLTALRNRRTAEHNMSRTSTHLAWQAMLYRCTNPNSDCFHNYGGRGISVCDRWKSFANFFDDMGVCPPQRSIDRINNDGNYEPGNCRWATIKEQSNNRRTNRFMLLDGRRMTVAQWAEEMGICRETLYQRLSKGWSDQMALKTPQGRLTRSKTRNPKMPAP